MAVITQSDPVALFLATGCFPADPVEALQQSGPIYNALPADADRPLWGSILAEFQTARNDEVRARCREAAIRLRDVIDARP